MFGPKVDEISFLTVSSSSFVAVVVYFSMNQKVIIMGHWREERENIDKVKVGHLKSKMRGRTIRQWQLLNLHVLMMYVVQ